MDDVRVLVHEEFAQPVVVVGERAVGDRRDHAEDDKVIGDDQRESVGLIVVVDEDDLSPSPRVGIEFFRERLVDLLADSLHLFRDPLLSFIIMDGEVLGEDRPPLETRIGHPGREGGRDKDRGEYWKEEKPQ